MSKKQDGQIPDRSADLTRHVAEPAIPPNGPSNVHHINEGVPGSHVYIESKNQLFGMCLSIGTCHARTMGEGVQM